jgi:hypothetical protein
LTLARMLWKRRWGELSVHGDGRRRGREASDSGKRAEEPRERERKWSAVVAGSGW